MKLVTSSQMRALEQSAVDAGTPLDELMEQAGLAVAQEAWLSLGVVAGRRVLVLVGPGNNGGDGLVAVRHLADWEADVAVYALSARDASDANFARVLERNVPVFVATDDPDFQTLQQALDGAELVIDALLGTGRSRPMEGALAGILRRLRDARGRRQPPKVIAVDVPTGVDSDSGRADQFAVRADLTVSFGFAKVGLYVLPGSEHAGRVEVVDIGLPKDAERDVSVELMSAGWVRDRLPPRPKSANKGTFGTVLVVAGSSSYPGAARLTAEACYRAGAGLVRLACSKQVQAVVAPAVPEVTYAMYGDEERTDLSSTAMQEFVNRATDGADVVLIGPGLSQGAGVGQQLVGTILFGAPGDARAVVDADGLNALAAIADWHQRLARACVLTPHPGEMARLLGTTVAAVQDDRLNVALRAASDWGQIVVLKGAHTIVAAPDGRATVSPDANPLLASAGTGDVLAGTIAGLLAQGMAPFEGAACGVFVHGFAGDELSEELGDRGLLASDLLPAIPRAMRIILEGRRAQPAASPFGNLAGLTGSPEENLEPRT